MPSRALRIASSLPFVVLFLAALPGSRGQLPKPDDPFQSIAVAGPVHLLLREGGGNVGVSVGPDGVLLVDDQFANLAPKLQAAIDALAGGPKAPRYLVNTHHHGDHTDANPIFGRSATVIAHDNVRKRLAQDSNKPMAPEGLPAVTYGASASVHFNGEEIRLTHYAACHTDGDTVVHFTKSNVVHLGDLFFHRRFPFIDLKSGGSAVGLERSVGELVASLPPDAKLIPGHGPLATVADLRAYHAMLADSLAIVRQALGAGKTPAQIVGDKLLAKYDSLSWPFISTDKFTETLATELSAKPEPRK
jgi:cyclase